MELLSPAGNFEKMKTAVMYGADAVYLAGTGFGLRAKAGNFDNDGLVEAFSYLRERGKKGYVTVNAYLKSGEFDGLKQYLGELNEIGPDALIVSDPGVFKTIKDMGIKIPVHISTQANVTNLQAVELWAQLGAERVILAREVHKDEVAYICKNSSIEIECFVHGAMCISMSGRCLISNYMTGRDANHGECTHPCRWNYSLVEEKRPGVSWDVEEDERGTYFYNSKDLCLIDHIGDMADMGVKSFKIEGRMKSIMYSAVVTGVYRQALDEAAKNPKEYKVKPEWMELLKSVSHRHYTDAFFGGNVGHDSMNYESNAYLHDCDYIGSLKNISGQSAEILCKNKFVLNEELNIITPDMNVIPVSFDKISDEHGDVEFTKPSVDYYVNIPETVPEGSILRRCSKGE